MKSQLLKAKNMQTQLLNFTLKQSFQLWLLSCSILLIPMSLSAQCPDNINASTQEKLNEIIADFPDCQNLAGYLRLAGTVNDISGLSKLRSVGRYTTITSESLNSLSGLDNLTAIGEWFTIEIPATNYSGLGALTTIGGKFTHSSTSVNFEGLESLSEIGGDFIISGTTLQTLDGLEALTRVGGKFQLFVWNNVEVVSGLPGVTSIGGGLFMNQCDKIKHVNIMPNLESVEGQVSLGLLMPALESITGFTKLKSVGERFLLQGSGVKKTLNFPALETVQDDVLLYTDAIYDLTNIKTVGGGVSILGRDASFIGFNLLESIGGRLTFASWYTTAIPAFSSLKTIGNQLNIASTDSIESFNSFPVLETIGGDLAIQKVKNSAVLGGFDELKTVVGNVEIEECDSFRIVTAFEKLESVGGNFELRFNRSLQDCGVLCNFFENGTIGGDISVIFNGTSGVSTCRYSQGVFLGCPSRVIDKIWDANPRFLQSVFPAIELAEDLTPTQIIQLMTNREGITSDGVTPVIIQIKFDFATTYTTNDPLLTQPWGDQSNEINGVHYGFILMTSPPTFDVANSVLDNGLMTSKKTISISIDNGLNITDDLSMIPPPIVLVHGTFADTTTWTKKAANQKSMKQALTEQGYRVFLVDYKATNGMSDPSSFMENSNMVWRNKGGIEMALNDYRDKLNYAVTQADVIGHSMGGVLPRVYVSAHYNAEGYLRNDNFQDGDINRLITIGSTHHGSHLGEFQQFLANGSPLQFGIPGFFAAQAVNFIGTWVGGSPPSDAVMNQSPESEALGNIGATEVPSHAITIRAPIGSLKDEVYDVGDSYLDLYKYLSLLLYYNGAIAESYLDSKLALCDRDLKSEETKDGFLGSDLYPGLTDAQIFKQMLIDGFDRNADELEALDGVLNLPQNIERFHHDFGETEMGSDIDPMILGFMANQEPIGVPDDMFKNLVMPSAEDLSPQESLLEALRSLIFNHDDNDGVVRLESQSGELEKVCPECVSFFDTVLHSPAPQYPEIQGQVLKLLNGGLRDFHVGGFPPAGNAQQLYYPPNRIPFYAPPKSGVKAVCASGIVPSHAQQYARIADQENVIIMARPVNADATPLISRGAATKEMDVKPKSSNWGPQKGYLPVLQRYSKIWKVYEGQERKNKIDEYDPKAQDNLNTGITTARHLSVKACEQEFWVYIDEARFSGENDQNALDEIVLVPKVDPSMVCLWGKKFDPAEPINECEPMSKDHQLVKFEVMATPREQEKDGETNRYLTADYDLLMIGFYEGENLQYTTPEAVPFKEGVGSITTQQENLVDKLNQAVESWTGYSGGNLTHHGPENQFNKSPYVDYPITVFMPDNRENGFFNGPKGQILSIDMGPPGFRDIHLKRFVNRMRKKGFDLVDNPVADGWHWHWNDSIGGFELADSPMLGDYVAQLPENRCDKAGMPSQGVCSNPVVIAADEPEGFEEYLFGRSKQLPFQVSFINNKVSEDWLELSIESDRERMIGIQISSAMGVLYNHQKLKIKPGVQTELIDISNTSPGIHYLKIADKVIPFLRI